MDIEQLKNELSLLAKQQQDKAVKAYQRNHLHAQDHEMFERIFNKIALEDSIPLRDRVITIQRVNRSVNTQVIRRVSQNESKSGKRSVSDRIHRRPKKSTVSDTSKTSALDGLQSRLNHLMEQRIKPTVDSD